MISACMTVSVRELRTAVREWACCILALIFPILMKYFPKCSGKGSFPKSQIKSLLIQIIGRCERDVLNK